MLDALDKKLLKTVADLEVLPKGAFNIRKNGKLLQRQVSANINIETNAEGTGIIVTIKPGTKNESVHIPVILSQAGLFDVVYNSFIIGEGADVTIIAGCGIHCGTSEPEVIPVRLLKSVSIRYTSTACAGVGGAAWPARSSVLGS